MPVFMIVPTEDADRLVRVVSASFTETERFILPGNHACFVKFGGTSGDYSPSNPPHWGIGRGFSLLWSQPGCLRDLHDLSEHWERTFLSAGRVAPPPSVF